MNYQPIPSILPAGQRGIARIEHFSVSKDESKLSHMRAAWSGDRMGGVDEGTYARLYVGNSLMMSDTQMEKHTNREFCRRAHGDVLVAGLGIGLILSWILEKQEVDSVLVVEKYADVAELVAPHYQSSKLSIEVADIFDYTPPKGKKYNVIYFDIWPDICIDNLQEIAKLHQRFKGRLNRQDPECWMSSWQHDLLKYRKSQERRNYRY